MEPTYSKRSISATAAQVITTACIRKTAELDISVAVVVVDDEGAAKTLIRMDDVPASCAKNAHGLAAAALEAAASSAGHRLVVDGQVVGAIGVSGAGAADDAVIAAAGVAAMSGIVDELAKLVADALDC